MGKPKFDPTKPFEEAAKPKFDAAKPYEEAPEEDKTSALMTGLESYGDVPLMGYLPQAQAGLESASEYMSNKSNELLDKVGLSTKEWQDAQKLKEMGIKTPKDDFLAKRDENIARQELQEIEHPTADKVGTGLGIAGAALLTRKLPAGNAKEISRLKRLLTAGGVGGATGAVYNPGDKKGEYGGLQAEERLKNAGKGFVAGGLAQGGGELLGKGLSVAGTKGQKYFNKLAETKAAKAAGAIQKDFKKFGEDKLRKMGRKLLDKKIVKPFSTPTSINEGVEVAADAAEQKLVGIIDDVTAKSVKTGKGFISAKKVRDKIVNNVKKEFEGIPAEKVQGIVDEIDSWYADMPEIMTVQQMQKFKTTMQKFINKSNYQKDLAPGKAMGMMKTRSGARQSIEDAAEELTEELGESGGKVVKEANEDLGNMYFADEISEQGMARGTGNRAISLSDYIAGTAGAADGGVTAATLAAANKGIRTYGNSMAATGANALQKGLSKIGKTDIGAKALGATIGLAPGAQKIMSGGSNVLNRVAENPDLIEKLSNDKLKASLRKQLDKNYTPEKKPVENDEAKQRYLEGN